MPGEKDGEEDASMPNLGNVQFHDLVHYTKWTKKLEKEHIVADCIRRVVVA